MFYFLTKDVKVKGLPLLPSAVRHDASVSPSILCCSMHQTQAAAT